MNSYPLPLDPDEGWYFLCVNNGCSILDTIRQIQINYNERWIQNIWGYYGSGNGQNAISETGLFENAEYTYEAWHNMYDNQNEQSKINAHLDLTNNGNMIIGNSESKFCYPIWVQIVKDEIDIVHENSITINPNITSSNIENDRFKNDGWYAVGIPPGESIESMFFSKINKTEKNKTWTLHKMYIQQSNNGFETVLEEDYKTFNNIDIHSLSIDEYRFEQYDFLTFWKDITDKWNIPNPRNIPLPVWIHITRN